MSVNPADLTAEEIAALKASLDKELGRRQGLETFGEKACELVREYREAFGYSPPEEWQRPEVVWEAFLPGDTVTHSGGTWVTVGHCVLTEPGEGNREWREATLTEET